MFDVAITTIMQQTISFRGVYRALHFPPGQHIYIYISHSRTFQAAESNQNLSLAGLRLRWGAHCCWGSTTHNTTHHKAPMSSMLATGVRYVRRISSSSFSHRWKPLNQTRTELKARGRVVSSLWVAHILLDRHEKYVLCAKWFNYFIYIYAVEYIFIYLCTCWWFIVRFSRWKCVSL